MFPPNGAPSRRLQLRFLSCLALSLTVAATGCNLLTSHDSQNGAVSVAVVPGSMTVHSGHTVQFAASVTGSTDIGVTWTLSSHAPQLGRISPAGLYTAPSGLTSSILVKVIATSSADATQSAIAAVTVTPVSPVSVSVSPQAAILSAGAAQQLVANVTGANNSAVTWSLSSSASQPGSVSTSGLYTAPSSLSNSIQVTVTATSVADATQSASAVLTVNPVIPVRVSVSPQTATTQAGTTEQFSASVTGSTNTSVTWSLASSASQPGSISSTGLYTAPLSVNSSIQVAVTATSVADPTQSSSASLTVTPTSSVHVSISPLARTLQAGATQQFTPTVTGTTNTAVTWSLLSTASQPGNISSTGLYSAPSSVSSNTQVTVTATSVADPTQSASANLTITPAPSIHVGVAPLTVTLQAGATQQFTPTVTGTTNTAVTWSLLSTASQPGNISSTGLYSAPSSVSSNTQVTVTATSVADPTQSASANLTITPAPSIHVAVAPKTVTLQAGATLQFLAAVTGTSNTAVTWSMSPQTPQFGRLSSAGFYTSPSGITNSIQLSVTATSVADSNQSATASVTVNPAPVVSVTVAPSSATLSSGSTRQFTATVTGTNNTSVTWSAALGTVSAGAYTAPVVSVQESDTLTATSVADPTQKASATIAVLPKVSAGPGVPASFFGMHINRLSSPWPTVPFASYRSLNSSYIKWADINTANQTYNWVNFDKWMAEAQANGQDIMYTLFTTPSWASSRGINSSNPNNNCVYVTVDGPGACDPPNDLNADGTGTDQHWKDFITAVMNHVGPGKIKYWEVWNEYNINIEWTGTQPQMLRLAKDAYTIVKAMDPNAMVTTPSVANANIAVHNWVLPYLQAGGGQYADVIAVHGYVEIPGNACPSACPSPEVLGSILDKIRAVMVSTGQQDKPLFDTEGSWAETTQMTDADLQAAFTARYYMIHAAGTATSKGMDKLYWYGWDFRHSGQFYDSKNGRLNLPGVAYQQVYNWLIGAVQNGCSATGTRWTCPMTRTGYQAEAIWDSSQNCSGGSCSTVNVNVGSSYVQYRDLTGNVTPISNNTVPVGIKPILLESGNPPTP